MKKFLAQSFGFFLIVFIILIILNFRFKQTITPYDYFGFQYKEILHPVYNANTIILGTSHATHGIQPALLNDTGTIVYNFACDGANPEFYQNWYQTIFKPNYPKPDKIIFAVEWFLFDTEELWRTFEHDALYYPTNIYLSSLISNKGLNKTTLINNRFPVLKNRRSPQRLLNYDPYPYLTAEYNAGFIPVQEIGRPINELEIENFKIEKDQQKIFENLINTFIKEGIELIFINPPAYNSSGIKYKNSGLQKYYDSICVSNNIPFLQYNTERRSYINNDKKYFNDGGHMNYAGSSEFSRMLKNDLEQ
ncbi:MAG: hypothetical protein IPH42_08650 [Bacteroidetes bacterium]|nr:hypothetical protein [Bacteroidota bacterium]